MQFYNTGTGLQGIDRIPKPPLSIDELFKNIITNAGPLVEMLTNLFMRNKSSSIEIATRTIVVYDGKGCFKITNSFPWKSVKPEYLGKLNDTCMIDILPSEYNGIIEPEYRMLHPEDTPFDWYAVLNTKLMGIGGKNPILTRKEIVSLDGTPINRPLYPEEVERNPLLENIFLDTLHHGLVKGILYEQVQRYGLGLYFFNPRKRGATFCSLECKFDDDIYLKRIHSTDLLPARTFILP